MERAVPQEVSSRGGGPGYGKNDNVDRSLRRARFFRVVSDPHGQPARCPARDDGVGRVRDEGGSLAEDGERFSTAPGQFLAGTALVLILALTTACGPLGPDTGARAD